MAFIDQQDILNATSGGLDIIYLCYPQAKTAQSKSDKRFKIRTDERTPSASLKQLQGGVWVTTDFGGDQTPRNGIQVYMKEECLTFREALVKLAGIYGVGGISHEINRAGFEKRPATKEEKEKEYIFAVIRSTVLFTLKTAMHLLPVPPITILFFYLTMEILKSCINL